MNQFIDDALQLATKVCFGCKPARNFIASIILLMLVLLYVLTSDFCKEGVKLLVMKIFHSKMIIFFGIVKIHYGLCLILYLFTGTFLLVVATILVAWLAKKWKQKRERDAILNQIISERQSASITP